MDRRQSPPSRLSLQLLLLAPKISLVKRKMRVEIGQFAVAALYERRKCWRIKTAIPPTGIARWRREAAACSYDPFALLSPCPERSERGRLCGMCAGSRKGRGPATAPVGATSSLEKSLLQKEKPGNPQRWRTARFDRSQKATIQTARQAGRRAGFLPQSSRRRSTCCRCWCWDCQSNAG
jgi:hypothetical protein